MIIIAHVKQQNQIDITQDQTQNNPNSINIAQLERTLKWNGEIDGNVRGWTIQICKNMLGRFVAARSW